MLDKLSRKEDIEEHMDNLRSSTRYEDQLSWMMLAYLLKELEAKEASIEILNKMKKK